MEKRILAAVVVLAYTVAAVFGVLPAAFADEEAPTPEEVSEPVESEESASDDETSPPGYGDGSAGEQMERTEQADDTFYSIYAEELPNPGVLTYSVQNDAVTITDCEDTATGEQVAAAFEYIYKIENLRVTSIGDKAFFNCAALDFIELPSDVTSIGYRAFYLCNGLTSLDIPEEVTSIGNEAFCGCIGLSSITIPEGVTSIEAYTFAYCTGLTSVDIPESVTSIGNYAFYYCTSLTEITIPASVTSIGSSAFFYCTSLSSIIIEHGMLDLPIYFLTETSFRDDLKFYVPMSVISVGGQAPFSFTPPSNTTLSGKPTIYGIKESFITVWAEANSIKLQKIDGKVTKWDDNNDIWLKIPYQYIIETSMPDNIALKFEIVSGRLPDGLGLMQKGGVYEGLTMLAGQFYGAPLETGEFPLEVEVRADVGGWNYLLDLQEITLTVEEPEGDLGDVALAQSNDYPVAAAIGEATGEIDGISVDYVLTAVRDEVGDRVFKVADVDLNGDDVIDEADSNFPYFVHFWIDGQVLVWGGDYYADPGSTIVTVEAKTFQTLNNSEHTVAAEFSINGVQTVAAQKFTLNLTNPADPEDTDDPDVPGADTGVPGNTGGSQNAVPARGSTDGAGESGAVNVPNTARITTGEGEAAITVPRDAAPGAAGGSEEGAEDTGDAEGAENTADSETTANAETDAPLPDAAAAALTGAAVIRRNRGAE